MRQLWIGVLCCTVALSQKAHGAGINLFWDECGPAGVSNKSFACDRNGGEDILIASFVLPKDVPDFVGILAQVDIRTPGVLPDWWRHGDRLRFGDECRDTSGLNVLAEFENLSVCVDPYRGIRTSGYAYDVEFFSEDRARLRFQCAMEPKMTNALVVDEEYYGFQMILLHDKAVGEEACAGCALPACIVLNEVRVSPASVIPEVVLTNPERQNYAKWQEEAIPHCPEATRVPPTTWGRVRALYR